MNADNEGSKALIWAILLGAAAIAIAAILLYLRDRRRDARKVPRSARIASEKMTFAGANGLILGFFALGAFSQARDSATFLARAGWVLLAMYLAWRSIVNWRLYIKHRAASLSDTDEPGSGTG